MYLTPPSAEPPPTAAPVRPEVEWARTRITYLTSLAQDKSKAWHEAIDGYEADYFQVNTGDTSTKDDNKKVRLPDIANTADHGAAILKTAGYSLSLDRPGEKEADGVKSEATEAYLRMVLDQNAERTGEYVKDAITDMQMRIGAGFLHWLYVHDAIAPPLNAPPIEIYVVDPRKVNVLPGGPRGQFRVVAHCEQRSLADMQEFLMLAAPTDTVARDELFREYGTIPPEQWYDTKANFWNIWMWDLVPSSTIDPLTGAVVNGQAEWKVINALMYGNAVLRPFEVMQHYDHLPWELVPAKDTGHKEYALRWIPMWFHARSLVRTTERIQGQMYDQMEDIAQMPYVAKGGSVHQEPPDISGGPSNVMKLFYDQEFIPPQYGSLMRDLYPQLEITQERIDRTLFPRSMYGAGSSGSHSGYAFDMSHEGGKLRLIEPRNRLAFGFKRMFTGLLSLIARHLADVPVYATYRENANNRFEREAVVLYGRDLFGWTLDVLWRATMPGDEQREMMQVQAMRGFLPDSLLMERLGIENPRRQMDERFTEQIKYTDPRLAQARAYELLSKAGSMPDVMRATQYEMGLKTQEVYAKAYGTASMVMPPQQAQQFAQMAVQQFMQSQLMQMQMAMQQGGQPPQGAPQGQPQPGQPGRPPQGGRAAPNQQALRDPRNGVANQLRGGPPPGNPADPARPYREAANQMNPSSMM